MGEGKKHPPTPGLEPQATGFTVAPHSVARSVDIKEKSIFLPLSI